MPVAQANSMSSLRDSWITSYQPVIETCVVTLLAVLLLWKGVLPGWRTLNTDFSNYYIVARLIREHYCLDRIYDWIWLQRIAIRFGINHQLVGFLGLTPFSSLPIIPLSWLPVLEAKRVWIVCNLALLAISVQLLSKTTGLNLRRVWLIALCAAIPLRTSFLFGQMHILVLALLVMAYVCHMSNRQITSGCCIALAAALKIYPIFFCLYFAVKRRWKAFFAALLGTALCLFLSYTITGPTAMKLYLFQQLPRTLQGESNNPFIPALTSSSALFHRLFLFEPELNPRPLVSSSLLYAVSYPLWQAILATIVLLRLRTNFRADEREALDWSLFLVLLVFLSSAPASYQFVVLIAAAVPTIAALTATQRKRAAISFFFLYLAACNVGTLNPRQLAVAPITPLLYLKLWVGVAMLLFYWVILKPPATDKALQDTNSFHTSRFKVAAIIFSLWLIGVYSAWSHLRDIKVANNERLTIPDNAYLRGRPLNTDSGLIYVAMLPDGYRVLRGNALFSDAHHEGGAAMDELSFTANSSGKDLWVEVASRGGSRLVHFISGAPDPAPCSIGDAEYPMLSVDGSALAFLREDHGRGSLWMVDPRDCAAHGGNLSPM
ncbi:MAG TPA: glycosyltransferase family 87 protein, partial [Silvibacterium sp.]|nr:glycosyltransferase family 87 protein [Silvibacterium sp.]